MRCRRRAGLPLVAAIAVAGCWHLDAPGVDEAPDGGETVAEGDAGTVIGNTVGSNDIDFVNSGVVATCPLDSGWPCACTYDSWYGDECDDGSRCAAVEGLHDSYLDLGICTVKCDDTDENDDTCPPHQFAAVAECNLVDHQDDEQLYCILHCTQDSECPPGQTCKQENPYALLACYP